MNGRPFNQVNTMTLRQFASVRAKYKAGIEVQTQNFGILAEIDFSARTTNKIRRKSQFLFLVGFLSFSFVHLVCASPNYRV